MSKDTTYVATLPACDICSPTETSTGRREAAYNGKTFNGPWAFMCYTHFGTHGVGLGLGRGQRLIVKEPSDAERVFGQFDSVATVGGLLDHQAAKRADAAKRAAIMDAIDSGDSESVWDLVGDGDLAEWL